MGQGLTSSPSTYTKLKDLLSGPLPKPSAKPTLDDCMPEAIFTHFIDDDFGGGTDFEALFTFLHKHYFPRLEIAKVSLNPEKSKFFYKEISILGMTRNSKGIRLSANKVTAIVN